MDKFRQRIYRFMQGRYGVDQFSRFLIYFSLCLLIITLFVHSGIIYTAALAVLVYSYFRVLSRNISRRNTENQKYLQIRYRIVGRFNSMKARIKDSKTHRIFKCPGCGQKIRVPKGKGRISIKCPRCRIEFIKKTWRYISSGSFQLSAWTLYCLLKSSYVPAKAQSPVDSFSWDIFL